VRLTEIFRQAETSRIVRNAHRILQGAMPESASADEEADFFVVERRDPGDAAQVVCELATRRIPRRFGFDPKTEVQVLTPMHRGPAGTIALNERLQALLNPGTDGLVLKGGKVRAGDRVMQLRNDYDRDVYNGDTGLVTRVSASERALTARFDGRDVEYDETGIESLALAYATSIHKSQGSEYPAVVIPILTSHFVMLTQNLIYTAVTRAKKLCVLVADPRALRLALSEIRREDRSTRLAARLRQWQSGRHVADFR
jgi:exodeoxyribonuclease V alpha subunit